MRKLLVAAVAAGGLLAGCATDAGLIDENVFAEGSAGVFDTDGDGLFESAEYDAFGDTYFDNWDTNDDDWLDAGEFDVGWDSVGFDDETGAFETFDNDDNGFLGDDEFFDDEEFGAWDTDRDGALDDDEWGF